MRLVRHALDLLPDLADVDAQVLHIGQAVPNLLQQETMGQYLAGMLNQDAQDIVFLRRELYLLPGHLHDTLDEIDGELTDLEHRLFPVALQPVAQGDAAGQRLAHLLAAEIALGQGDTAPALRLTQADGTRRPELLLSAQAEVRSGQAADAAQRLQTWVATQPRDATAWELLSTAYGAEHQPLRAVRADAESKVAQLDYAAALDRLKAGQDMVRRGGPGIDNIEASIIDTRARAVASLLREQTLER